MHIDWRDLGAGFALYLVLEGVFPFLRPAIVRQTFGKLMTLPDEALRLLGLSSMIAGCVLLYFIRS
jgi:uncharacterized protein YjeT (DUF2065 family)